MKNKRDEIIYVGKAKNLKKRVLSYFSKTPKTQKTQALVREAINIETIITNNEQEALLLEVNLIKKHFPKYNIKLKNNSNSYPFIAYSKKSDFPFFEVKYDNSNKNFEYYGPYPQKGLAYYLCKNLNQTLKLKTCSEIEFNRRKTPCLLYQMNKCSGPCVKLIDKENYQKDFNLGLKILQGKSISDFIASKEKEMAKLAEEELFEKAQKIKILLKSIDTLIQKQSVINSNENENRVYINISREGNFYYIGICFFNLGKMENLETYSFEDYDHEELNSKYIEEFIINYFAKENNKINIISPEKIELPEILSHIVVKESKKDLDKRVMELILTNLSRSDKEVDDNILLTIKEEFGLFNIPKKIECYDISHFQGKQVVGSKSCLINGVPSKNYYRKYKLSQDKNDDFNNLKEILTRRLNDEKDEFPDLIIIDGGTPQLNKIRKLFQEKNIQGIDLIALAKEKITNEFSDTDIEKNEERVVIASGETIILQPGRLSYKLFTSIRNEAHRFAIKYHRELRKKVFFT